MLLLPTITIPYEGPYTSYRPPNAETGQSVDRNPPGFKRARSEVLRMTVPPPVRQESLQHGVKE